MCGVMGLHLGGEGVSCVVVCVDWGVIYVVLTQHVSSLHQSPKPGQSMCPLAGHWCTQPPFIQPVPDWAFGLPGTCAIPEHHLCVELGRAPEPMV